MHPRPIVITSSKHQSLEGDHFFREVARTSTSASTAYGAYYCYGLHLHMEQHQHDAWYESVSACLEPSNDLYISTTGNLGNVEAPVVEWDWPLLSEPAATTEYVVPSNGIHCYQNSHRRIVLGLKVSCHCGASSSSSSSFDCVCLRITN